MWWGSRKLWKDITINLTLNLTYKWQILFWLLFLHRRDHIREEQSLRICQGHPNIVRLQEVFQDDVSAISVLLSCTGSLLLMFYTTKGGSNFWTAICDFLVIMFKAVLTLIINVVTTLVWSFRWKLLNRDFLLASVWPFIDKW